MSSKFASSPGTGKVINEIRYGGATYVNTGRGLPTDRRPFIGEALPGKSPDAIRQKETDVFTRSLGAP